jgi:hypothetical protein
VHAQDPSTNSDAGPAAAFGGVGQIVVSSDATLIIQHTTPNTTTVSVWPAADFFVLRNLSVGGALFVDYVDTRYFGSTTVGLGPRVGYSFAFTDAFGIWPKLGFSYRHKSQHFSSALAAGGQPIINDGGNDAFTLNLFVPVMFHPVRHFFFGFGPFLDADLAGDDKVTTFGGKLTLGGWFET